MPAPNVECTRCGHRWYAEEFAERDIVPHYCPRCYREDIQEIPEPPTAIEKQVRKARDQVSVWRKRYAEYSKQFTLWRENHRELIEFVGFFSGMFIILAIIYVFIFVWG
ncbi:MAG: hypothetical protein MUP66_00400 [Candidatus Nanohaloarchaeota archaeon QJJ-5]|nr:hypothetical protein [Candidatus Nanohaloarchaeota archaeon QJJ-5]